MGTSTLIGRRANGRPIWLIQGGAEDPEPQPEQTAPPADDAAALRAELEQVRAERDRDAERLRALMAGGEQPATPEEDDNEDDKEGRKPVDPEMAKLYRALRTANRESIARKNAADKLRADWEAQDKARQEQLAEAQRLSEAAEKARQEAEARYKPATIRDAAVPALLAAGAKPDRADRLVRLLDATTMDVDAAGEVTGLAEQVAAVKAEWPELFVSDEPEKPRPPRLSGGDRPPVENAPSRSADRLAAQVLGGAA